MQNILKITFTTICILITSATTYAADKLASKEELYEGPEYAKAFADPKDTNLPNVLLIGDSISNAYTVDVRKQLKGKADVFRIPSNGKNSAFGAQNIDHWLKANKWDLIHFNWGLWDICYRNPKAKTQGHRDKLNGKITATPEQYKKHITSLVATLKKSGAKLIWCATTPVPDNELGRIKGDEIKYNKIAQVIMEKNHIAINDLHSHAMKKLKTIQIKGSKRKGGDVHFTTEGSAYLAKKVASEILPYLEAKTK